jgi:S1-C subfamily serine protease
VLTLIEEKNPGDTVTLSVTRSNEQRQVRVQLQASE